MDIDPTKYRVSLLCRCKADLTYGYGSTVEEARKAARAAWRRYHRAEKIAEEVVEHAVPHSNGGSHYEEVSQ